MEHLEHRLKEEIELLVVVEHTDCVVRHLREKEAAGLLDLRDRMQTEIKEELEGIVKAFEERFGHVGDDRSSDSDETMVGPYPFIFLLQSDGELIRTPVEEVRAGRLTDDLAHVLDRYPGSYTHSHFISVDDAFIVIT